jgi:hypothetical protein
MITWQYIAGFFDGEGCIHVREYTRKRVWKSKGKGIKSRPVSDYYIAHENILNVTIGQNIKANLNFHTTIVQKEVTVLYEIQLFLRENGIETAIYVKKKTSLTGVGNEFGVLYFSKWRAVKKFLESVFPYLIVKKEKAALTLEYIRQRHEEELGAPLF